jgi:hypothetical protein
MIFPMSVILGSPQGYPGISRRFWFQTKRAYYHLVCIQSILTQNFS